MNAQKGNRKAGAEVWKESPGSRKKRVSSGIQFRPSVFEDKRRKEKHKTGNRYFEDDYRFLLC